MLSSNKVSNKSQLPPSSLSNPLSSSSSSLSLLTVQKNKEFPLLNYNSIMNRNSSIQGYTYSYVDTSGDCYEQQRSISLSTNTRDQSVNLQMEKVKSGNSLKSSEEIFNTAMFRVKRRKSSMHQDESNLISYYGGSGGRRPVRTHKVKRKLKNDKNIKKVIFTKKTIRFAFGPNGNLRSNDIKSKVNNFTNNSKSLIASEAWNCIYLLIILALVIVLSALFIFLLIAVCTDPVNRLCYSLH